MRTSARLVLALLLLASALPAATTYYVDSTSASATQDGSLNAPWHTLAPVNAKTFAAGDVIALKRGALFTGRLAPLGSGASGAPITITGYGAGTTLPRIDGGGAASAVELNDQQWWEIVGLDVTGGAQYGIHVTADQSGVFQHIRIAGCVVHDIQSTPRWDSGLIVVDPFASGARFADVTVEDCTAANTDLWYGIHVGFNFWAGDPAPSLRTTNTIIRRCVVHDVYGDNITVADTDGALIEANTAYNGGRAPAGISYTPNAIWSWSSNAVTIQLNEAYAMASYGVDGGAFDADWGSTNTLIQYNYAHDNQGYAVAIFGAHNTVTANTIVRFNVFAHDGQHEVFWSTWDGGSLDGASVYGNTIVATTSCVMSPGLAHTATPLVVRDDILVSSSGTIVDTAAEPAIVLDHDVGWSTGAAAPWSSAWGAYADPRLSDAGYHAVGFPTTSLRLQAGSPAYGAGVAVGDMGTRDFFGDALTATIDAGADQLAPAVAPSIAAQPASLTVTAGQTATFSVGATGTAPLAYQWRRNGTAISGATGASYTTPATTTADSGTAFSVVVSDGAGSVTSADATLTVNAAAATPYGGTARAIPGRIEAEDFDDGGEGLAYNDSDAGNNGGAYRNTDVDIRASIDVGGGYQVGWFGAGEWMQYTCNAAAAGVFTASVRGANGDAGGTLHIAIDGTDVTGAIAFANTGGWDTFQTIGHAGIAIGAGRHAVRLYCDTGAVDVNWIAFAVTPPPVISAQPTGATVTAPQTATFSVGATGTGALSYQWRRNGAAIAGATAATYTTPATSTADSGAVFTVVVSDVAGSTTSSGATLTVDPAATPAPSIATQPASVTVTAGQTATFSVVASGGGTLTYQWRRNGAAIAGATSASYTTPATTTADSGAVFSVVVANAGGSVASAGATLTVNAVQTPVATPYGGAARAIPGRIEAEDFDDGGEGVAYHDRDVGNDGGAYRATDVDIRTSIDVGGGYQVGWFGGDEWMQYTTTAATSGSYTLTVRVANGDVGGTFHVTIDGSDVTGAMTIANTGGWDAFTTLSHGGVAIASGTHRVRIVSDSGAVDVNWFAFAADTTTSTGTSSGGGGTTTPPPPTTSVTGSTGSGGGCGRGAGLIAVGLALFLGGRRKH